MSPGVRYLNPALASDEENSSEKDDVFALGTVLYEIVVGNRLFSGKDDRQIHHLLQTQQFPDLSSITLPLRDIINKCWRQPDYTTNLALIDLSRLFCSND